MKCDELKERPYTILPSGRCYDKDEADAAIAELKAEIRRKEGVEQRWFERCMEERTENAKLKKKLENVQASMYADVVDANMKNRRLKRALYKACANWALSTLAWLDCIDQGEPRKWSEMRQKCLKKAEEYK